MIQEEIKNGLKTGITASIIAFILSVIVIEVDDTVSWRFVIAVTLIVFLFNFFIGFLKK